MSKYWLLICVAAVFIFVTLKNLKLFKRYKHNKLYIECYEAFITNAPEAYDRVLDYVATDSSIEYKNKARMFEIIMEMDLGIQDNAINNLDLNEIFCSNGKVDLKEKVTWNSDTFIWIIFAIAKAKKLGLDDVATKLMAKLEPFKEAFEFRVEYQMIVAVYEALYGDKDKAVEFFMKMLNGDYAEYGYDKNFIGVYKRIATAMLAYMNKPVDDEFFESDLKEFAKMRMGKMFMGFLGIHDKYYVPDEVPEETVEEIEETPTPEIETKSEEVKEEVIEEVKEETKKEE